MSPADEAAAAYLLSRGIAPSEAARGLGAARREVDEAMRRRARKIGGKRRRWSR